MDMLWMCYGCGMDIRARLMADLSYIVMSRLGVDYFGAWY